MPTRKEDLKPHTYVRQRLEKARYIFTNIKRIVGGKHFYQFIRASDDHIIEVAKDYNRDALIAREGASPIEIKTVYDWDRFERTVIPPVNLAAVNVPVRPPRVPVMEARPEKRPRVLDPSQPPGGDDTESDSYKTESDSEQGEGAGHQESDVQQPESNDAQISVDFNPATEEHRDLPMSLAVRVPSNEDAPVQSQAAPISVEAFHVSEDDQTLPISTAYRVPTPVQSSEGAVVQEPASAARGWKGDGSSHEPIVLDD